MPLTTPIGMKPSAQAHSTRRGLLCAATEPIKPPRPIGGLAVSFKAPWPIHVATKTPFNVECGGACCRCKCWCLSPAPQRKTFPSHPFLHSMPPSTSSSYHPSSCCLTTSSSSDFLRPVPPSPRSSSSPPLERPPSPLPPIPRPSFSPPPLRPTLRSPA